MSESDNFATSFEKLRTEALTEIAFGNDAEAYEAEAIAAALAELRKRRASSHGLKDIVVENNRILEVEIARADEPNEWWRRIFTGITAPTVLIPWVMAGRLEAKGFYKKARDTRWWLVNGLLFWILLIIFVFEA